MTFVRGAVAALVVAAGVRVGEAAETVTGRWAVDEPACTRWYGPATQSSLIVSETSLR